MKLENLVALFALLAVTALFSVSAFAHGGRTDARGGHKDSRHVSGLGSYHYHCGGHPAHLHKNGVCPYSAKAKPQPQPKPAPAAKSTR